MNYMEKYNLTDSQFTTAREKGLVLKQWTTFLKHGCKQEHFKSRLYKHLINHCSFIAHYNGQGFYATYFGRGADDRANFLGQFDATRGTPPASFEYGDTYWAEGDYSDINLGMVDIATEYIPNLLTEARDQQRQDDLALAQMLFAKHGVEVRT